jgi:hypothetical protein
MNFELITSRSDSHSAFETFKAFFAAGARYFSNHAVGWPGGSSRFHVHWHGSAGIWGLFLPKPFDEPNGRRFWICFGDGDPASSSMLHIVVEMNPPHEGDDGRTGGFFLRDEQGGLYVAHTGKVGGGRPGIGPSAFREFSRTLGWQEIITPRRHRRQAVVFGPLDDPRLTEQLARYVRAVADFKEHAVHSTRARR